MCRPSILCIDNYETSLAGWCLYLQNAGYSVTTARTAQEGLERFAVAPVDLVLLDYLMSDAFLQKGQSPMVVLDKIRELLQLSGKAS
jgi:CheY-like chemotaxis protein